MLRTIYSNNNILAYIFSQSHCELTSDVELPSADKVWQVVLALLVEAMKEREMTSRLENLGTAPHRGTFPSLFTRFPAKSFHIPRILAKFTMNCT